MGIRTFRCTADDAEDTQEAVIVRLFGTDGVRGVANTELTPELAYQLGRAATLYFGAHSKARPRILIGRDTRVSVRCSRRH